MRRLTYVTLMFFIFNYVSFVSAEVNTQVIRLGMVAPLSGDFAPYGEQIRKGIEIAKAKLEKQGVYTQVNYENACLAVDVRSALNKLILKDNIQSLVGSYCVIGMLGAKNLLKDSQIISFQTSGATAEILTPDSYLFSTASRTKDEGRRLAEIAFNDLKLKKVAMLYLQTQWGQEIIDSFSQRFIELGGVVTGTGANLIGESNFRNELTRLRIGNPDALLIAHLGGTLGNAIRQAKLFGFKDKQLLATSDAEDQSVIEAAGELANGLKFISIETSKNLEEVSEFEKDFFLKYKERPTALSKHSFDATILSVDALRKCNFDKVCAKDQIYKNQNHKGASGIFSIDSDGGTSRNFILRSVVKGEFL
jgi:branched-chain amino acid transport system substrate-binding protein